MKTYRVEATCTISLSTLVMAGSKKEAIAIARRRNLEAIHSQGDVREEWVSSGELDGMPQALRAVREEQ